MGKDNEFLNAIKNGDVSAVRKVLVKFKSGPKGRKAVGKKLHINIPDDDGFTVLHHAALNENVEIVLALIEMEADPNARDKKGMCPLHMAAWAGKEQIVKTLLENKALVNLPSFSGETPLLLASQHGYANVVEILMKFQADPTIRNNNLESPIDVACQFGHAAVARFLLMRGEVIHMLHEKQRDPRFKLPLHLAAKGGHADVVRLLIESGADVNEATPQGTCLHSAALYGRVDVLKLLIEAGANTLAVNQKNMTPLDMVNQFTTSRAGIEIKQILKEATGEPAIFAKAITDCLNIYDETSLRFKTGDIITVLERNLDGRWKGSVSDGKVETVGYFPSTAVSILSSSRKEAALIGSISSSSDSSLNSSASGKEANQAMKSPRMSETNKPVGVVPVGTYEVLTLAKAQTPETKKPPNIPRLNSFKKDTNSAIAHRRRLHSNDDVTIRDGNPYDRSSSLDTSIDSGLHSHSTVSETTYDVVQNSGKRSSAEADVYDPLPPAATKPPRIYPTHRPAGSSHLQETEHHRKVDEEGASHHNKYADISIKCSKKPNLESPLKQPVPKYADVYIAENQKETPPRLHSEARPVPQPTNRKTELTGESYENMHLNQELLSRFGKSNEDQRISRSDSRSQGYEDMRSEDESFPSPPPPLPMKSPSPSCMPGKEDLPPSPPKKIESRALNYRRNESYENVQPRQIVPVHVQNPFNPRGIPNAAVQPPQENDDSSAHYENFMAPSLTMPNVHLNEYENHGPVNATEPALGRSATVAAKPKPVPLPPKMNRKTGQSSEPTSPSFDSVKTPYLSQLNLEALSQDERELFNWLVELKLPQYFKNFQTEGYDMVSTRGATPEDLTAIDITKAGHRKKLLSEITKLGPSSKLPTHKPDNVGHWLKLLGLCEYESNFIEGGFDEMDFIKDLDLSDLEMIEIRLRGHQKKLLLAVQRLSDVDLTAELDDIVQDEIKSPISKTEVKDSQQPPQQNGQNYDMSPSPAPLPPAAFLPPSSPAPLTPRNQSQSIGTQQASDADQALLFPPPPTSSELENTFVLQRDNLPPPSGKESTSHSQEQATPRVPPAVPTRTGSEKPRQIANQPPPVRARTISSPVAPKPKPKPRVGQNIGQVRTASEYHSEESPSKSVITPTPVATQRQNAIAEEKLPATPSKSKDLWSQSQQQQRPEKPPVRSKSISGIKPVISPRPSNIGTSLKQEKGSSQGKGQPGAANEARRGSVKKGPPPAPPRRESMSKKRDEKSSREEDIGQMDTLERSRTSSGPLDEKIRQAFRGKMHKISNEAPILEQSQEATPPIPPEEHANIDDELQATDSIMADIDDMIADFTNQLDCMFD